MEQIMEILARMEAKMDANQAGSWLQSATRK
jgi:hypothetical protein